MNYNLLTIFVIILVVLFFWIRRKRIHSKIPCERCGEIGDTISYSALSSNATRDYCKVFKEFYYKEPLNLCFWCAAAQDFFLGKILILSIGHRDQIKEAEKIWGDQAVEMLALLWTARENIEDARRILTEEAFAEVKPWLEKELGKSIIQAGESKNGNTTVDLIKQIKSLKWGISKSEYRKIFSNKAWHEDHPKLNAVGFSDNYLGYPLFVTAYFIYTTEKLAKVGVNYANLTDEQLNEVYKKLIENLTMAYGKPQFSETSEDRLSERKNWKTKDSIISVNLLLSKSNVLSKFNAFNISSGFGAASPSIGVTWGDIKNDPLSKSWDESGFSDENKPQKLPKNFKFSEEQIAEIKRAMKNDERN